MLPDLDQESRSYGAQLKEAMEKAEKLQELNSSSLRQIADDR
jgi:hypothetical protein